MQKHQEVANERAREAVYRKALHVKTARPVQTQGAASFSWTGTDHVRLPQVPAGEIAGRVALIEEHRLVPGGEFYIGSVFFQDDTITVFSWTAPVAATFFAETGHILCGSVAGRRAFDRRDDMIADFEDTWVRAVPGTRLFAERRLEVKRPAPHRPLPRSTWQDSHESPAVESSPDRPTASASNAAPTRDSAAPFGLRATDLLRRRLAAPRTERLGSVLSTLQPEQYHLVSRRGDEDLVIDGHPGTGKTVIAVHRAAYLVSKDYNDQADEEARVRKVLVIGPTDEYVDHVVESIVRLTGSSPHVRVISLRRLLAMASGLHDVPEGRAITRIEDGDGYLWQLAGNAVRVLKSRSTLVDRRSARVHSAYEILRSNGERGNAVTTKPEWVKYLKSLPAFEAARGMRNHVPLLAAIGWHVEPTRELAAFDHVVVDEAQDIMASEWALLDAINVTERWTLLGDMHQRRSDAALGSWKLVGDALGILDGAGEAPVTRIRRGFRSTKPIMAFANRLLPKEDRSVESLQEEGSEVTVLRVGEATLHDDAVTRATGLFERHAPGTVAIIAIERPLTELALRRQKWQKSPHHAHRWLRGDKSLDLLHPDHARGLEWDAVVVIEPARFPQNFLRHGLLYTSLTRANRELCVLHSEPLPEMLKGRR